MSLFENVNSVSINNKTVKDISTMGGGKLYSVKEQSTMSIYLKDEVHYFEGVTVLDEYSVFNEEGICRVNVPERGTYSFKLHKNGRHITRDSTTLTNGAGTSRDPYLILSRTPMEKWEDD